MGMSPMRIRWFAALIDSLNWRIQNDIDDILAKAITPSDMYRGIRDSQLVGISGFSKQGLPVIAVGVGLSTFDKASLLSAISTIDDLNYPEKTETYYIVNAPYIFSSCWKVVKPLLQERTRKKVQVLSGSGKDELLKIMDYESLPHFCRRGGSGSSRHYRNGTVSDCFSLDHPFHQQLYNYVKEQAELIESAGPAKHGSLHVDYPEPDPEDVKIAQTIECEFQRIGNQNGLSHSLHELKISGD
ncbi:phosphatidylinositol/phosphatidylcholine transfer protein sfh2 [Phtheirospermum japonicum]|uniref:Phosphatidylinositol/phosphatidylcholine transfer protein sfh2 n=1 Tax=Phtheirospermum japonicum TaxID=374723 RepID=A0A830C7C4_9LAMI|nr:phosphatidylinositol/phosphatidylcholine transfer protein sfh2 [Phtheirospermum japonicum]